jgi:hypothetical protein
MTITTLVVLMTALAEQESAPGRGPGPAARPPAAALSTASAPGVTCAMRVVRVSPSFDAGILAPPARTFGGVRVEMDGIVRDSVSPCAGASARRASQAGAGER